MATNNNNQSAEYPTYLHGDFTPRRPEFKVSFTVDLAMEIIREQGTKFGTMRRVALVEAMEGCCTGMDDAHLQEALDSTMHLVTLESFTHETVSIAL